MKSLAAAALFALLAVAAHAATTGTAASVSAVEQVSCDAIDDDADRLRLIDTARDSEDHVVALLDDIALPAGDSAWDIPDEWLRAA